MDIVEKIKKSITQALDVLELPTASFTVEHPGILAHGDYATNIAMVLAKQLGQKPQELALKIITQLQEDLPAEITSVELAGPGFINFKLSDTFFKSSNQTILEEGDLFGKLSLYQGKKILIEHSSPNLFKPFHIGHMMNNAIGESLVRLMHASGATVTTMSFPSDISLGIAKAIFILLEKNKTNATSLDISILGDAYVEGTKRYDEDESIHERVKEIADNLYSSTDSLEWKAFEVCKKFNIEYFEHIVKRLGSSFDAYIFESQAGESGKKLVTEHTPKVFTESEGAIVYIPDESNKGINTAVFINSQGNPTYEAKDLGLLALKFEQYHPDLSLFVTDHQQTSHFQVVLDAAQKIQPEWSEKSFHIPHGRMTLQGQKMSSRTGGVPLVTEMIDQVVEEVKKRAKDTKEVTHAEAIAIAALKFAVLRAKPGQNINFDPETSLSFEGDSGPYLQYTHARINSLIEKAASLGIKPSISKTVAVTDLEKILYRFPEKIQEAIVQYAPHVIVNYLLEVAHAFNSFYGANKLVDENDKELSAHRIALADATRIILANGLNLLAIEALDVM